MLCQPGLDGRPGKAGTSFWSASQATAFGPLVSFPPVFLFCKPGSEEQLEQMVDGDVVVKLSNQSGPNALEAIRIYGERVLPKLRG